MSGRNHRTMPDASIRMRIPPPRHSWGSARGLAAEMLAVATIGLALLNPVMAAEEPAAGKPAVQGGDNAPVLAENPEDISKLLPLLLTSSERKKLAAELEASIREGKLNAAKERLDAAIEMGTLAIVLADRLHDPGLLPALQTLGIRGGSPPPSPDQAGGDQKLAACIPDESGVSSLRELQDALDQEQARSRAISDELAALTEKHRALQGQQEGDAASTASTLSELREELQRERERSEMAVRELAALQEDYRTLESLHARDAASAASTISEMQGMLQHEREQGDDAERQLADAREELLTLKALKDRDAAAKSSRIAEMEEALAREQARSDAITHELANLLEEFRHYQGLQEAGAAPLIFRLAASGLPGPVETGHAAPPDQPPGPSLMTGSIAPPSHPAPAVWSTASVAPPSEAASAFAPPSVASPAIGGDGPGAGPASAAADDRLTARADALLRNGDVSGARLLLERSMETGNARAAFLLAETFDPNILSRLGVLGIRGDAARARELYAKALALGIAQAGERMEALR